MLYFAKVLCLILVATATNVSAENLVVLVKDFADEVSKVQEIINSAYEQVVLDLQRAEFNISETIDHMKEQGVWSQDEELAVDEKYKKWYDEQWNNLNEIKHSLNQSFSESKFEVENWISMCNDGRLRDVLAADLIKEVTSQVPEIANAATYMFDAVRNDIAEEIKNLENIRPSAMTSESSDDDHGKK